MSGDDIIALVELSRCNTAWLESRVAALEQRITDLESERDVWKAQCLNSEASRQLIAENAKLRKCVELYADKDNWGTVVYLDGYSAEKWVGDGEGPEPAQKCLEEVKHGE